MILDRGAALASPHAAYFHYMVELRTNYARAQAHKLAHEAALPKLDLELAKTSGESISELGVEPQGDWIAKAEANQPKEELRLVRDELSKMVLATNTEQSGRELVQLIQPELEAAKPAKGERAVASPELTAQIVRKVSEIQTVLGQISRSQRKVATSLGIAPLDETSAAAAPAKPTAGK
ncbi:MAG: hypothetical protein R3E12_12210 [Candidatus Eisenbacteria bacterium]